MKGGGLSGAGCAGACEDGNVWQGQQGSSTRSPWNIGFFLFFLFSEWLDHKYPTLSLLIHAKSFLWGQGLCYQKPGIYVWKLIWIPWSPSDYLVHCLDSGQVERALWQPSNIKGWPVKLT